jgi:hypothetical protein
MESPCWPSLYIGPLRVGIGCSTCVLRSPPSYSCTVRTHCVNPLVQQCTPSVAKVKSYEHNAGVDACEINACVCTYHGKSPCAFCNHCLLIPSYKLIAKTRPRASPHATELLCTPAFQWFDLHFPVSYSRHILTLFTANTRTSHGHPPRPWHTPIHPVRTPLGFDRRRFSCLSQPQN